MNEWLKADVAGKPIAVDRQNNVLRGYVVAQAGPFKSEGRGEFDHKSLRSIYSLMRDNKGGTKSRLGHPTLSADGLGKFLGRAHSPQMSTVMKDGKEIEAVRADLHFDKTAFDTPNGNLAKYVMDLAESDPNALSSSLVLKSDEEYRLDSKGRKMRDQNGSDLPPLWRPTEIHASDVVDTGDAVDGILSAQLSIDGLPDEIVRKAYPLALSAFKGKTRAQARKMLAGYVERLLANLPDDEDDQAEREARERLVRLWEIEDAA